jgi:hypothetical protein
MKTLSQITSATACITGLGVSLYTGNLVFAVGGALLLFLCMKTTREI